MILANVHKLPVIRRLLCIIGRHDYELKAVLNKGSAELVCFYCERVKISRLWARHQSERSNNTV